MKRRRRKWNVNENNIMKVMTIINDRRILMKIIMSMNEEINEWRKMKWNDNEEWWKRMKYVKMIMK